MQDTEKLNFWEYWKKDNTDQFMDKLANGVKSALKKSEVLEDLRPAMLELAREMISGRPDVKQLMTAEVMQKVVNPDYKKDQARLDKAIPKAPSVFMESAKRGGKFNEQKDYEKVQEKLNEIKPKMVNELFKILTNNPYSSPLLLKENLINKNYDENYVIRAFQDAFDAGWRPSEFQGDEYDQITIPINQGLKQAYSGQKTQRNIGNQILGER